MVRGDEDNPDTRSESIQDEPEPRAKDVLREQPARQTVGERLSRRLGQRRFERAPIVSCTGRLFERYDLADPWDPDSSDRPLSLGPVGMRFEDRRQPAPHARVKEPKKASERPVWTPPKGIPDARSATPTPAPKAPAPSAPARRKARAEAPRAYPAPSSESQPAPLPPVAPPPRGTVSGTPHSGRFRMRPTSSSGPKVREVRRVVEAPEEPREEAPAAATPPAPQPQSLDDLFGNLGGGGRDRRVGRKKE